VHCPSFDAAAQHARSQPNTDITGRIALSCGREKTAVAQSGHPKKSAQHQSDANKKENLRRARTRLK
jgi:hypothetical protein